MSRKVAPKGSGAPTGGFKLLYTAQCDDCLTGRPHTEHGPQVRLMESTAQEILYGGAAGGGKSYALRMLGVNYCLQYPGARVVLFRRTYRELEDTHIPMLNQEIPSYVATYHTGAHEFRFTNGSVLMLRFCENEEDVYSYDTFEADMMLFDELTAFTEFQYVYLMTRCRSTKKWWPGRKIVSATNPGNVGHTWVKRRFIAYCQPYVIRQAPDDEGGLNRQFIPAKISDNPALTKTDPDYIKTIQALKAAGHEELYRAKALGDWNVFTGQFFSRWRDQVHVVEDFDIPAEWLRYICVDWGIAVPHAVYWAARPPGTHTLYIYREQYGEGVPTAEQARMAYERTVVAQENIQFIVADPSMWAKEKDAHGDLMKANIDYWKEDFAGRCEVVKGNNERILGAAAFREALDWQGIENEQGIRVIQGPKLYFMRSCRHAVETIPQLIHSAQNPEDVDTKGEDHAYDAIRYLVRSIFQPPAKPKPVRYILDSGGAIRIVAA